MRRGRPETYQVLDLSACDDSKYLPPKPDSDSEGEEEEKKTKKSNSKKTKTSKTSKSAKASEKEAKAGAEEEVELEQEQQEGEDSWFIPRNDETIIESQIEEHNAREEHRKFHLPYFVNLETIEKIFGVGTRAYFTFIKFIIICNICLFIVGLINFLMFLISDDSSRPVMCNYPSMNVEYTDGCNESLLNYIPGLNITDDYPTVRTLSFFEKMFIAAYTPAQKTSWTVLTIISVVGWFVIPVVYYVYMSVRHKNADLHDNIFVMEGDEDRIYENEHVSSTKKFVCRTLTWTIFVLYLAISCVIVYYVQSWGTKDAIKDNMFLSLLVTCIISVISVIWNTLCPMLVTGLEYRASWTNLRRNIIIKLYAFKIINITVTYAALRYAFATEYACPLQDSGKKFFTLIITDIFVFNIVDYAMPFGYYVARKFATYYTRFRNIPVLFTENSDESERAEFDVSTELLELLYRQFVAYIGSVSMPMITFLVLIANIVEYVLDKLFFTKVTQKPKRLDNAMTTYVTIFLVISALAGLFSYPTGAFFVLTHSGVGDKCPMWMSDPKTLP